MIMIIIGVPLFEPLTSSGGITVLINERSSQGELIIAIVGSRLLIKPLGDSYYSYVNA